MYACLCVCTVDFVDSVWYAGMLAEPPTDGSKNDRIQECQDSRVLVQESNGEASAKRQGRRESDQTDSGGAKRIEDERDKLKEQKTGRKMRMRCRTKDLEREVDRGRYEALRSRRCKAVVF